MKVLVTGANGLLGQKLCELLNQDASIQLIATAKEALKFDAGKAKSDLLDITNAWQAEEIFSKYQPNFVIHTAAMTNVDECETEQEKCWEINVTATKHLLHAAAKYKVHFVFISTDFIFNGIQPLLDESAEAAPVNYYGASKLAAENLVKEYTGPWTIARTVLVYGFNKNLSRSNIVLWVKESLEAKKNIKVVNDQLRTPTLVEDLAMGCYLIIKNKAKGIYHISGDQLLSPFEMAMKVAAFFNLDASLIDESNSIDFTQTAKRPLKTGFNINKAMHQLQYNPRSFEESLSLLSTQMQQVEK
jgi:dTDP-4-dehydrorhamnose reductase